MINFFNKKKDDNSKNFLLNIASLLIHAAKIDENYTEKEKNIIKQTLIKLTNENLNIDELVQKAEETEKNSNQILNFTKEIKTLPNSQKIEIVEALWSIIYSNQDADIYETNLMRRLAGLLYIDNKVMSDIKEKIKKKFS
tara:strand:- start:128 stop:547 length:420 start_codon:yes stop_codon:yes gene_type:complete